MQAKPSDRGALAEAAEILIADQQPDGSWKVDNLGSPATYGSALATYTARSVLEAADGKRYAGPVARANAWLKTLKTPKCSGCCRRRCWRGSAIPLSSPGFRTEMAAGVHGRTRRPRHSIPLSRCLHCEARPLPQTRLRVVAHFFCGRSRRRAAGRKQLDLRGSELCPAHFDDGLGDDCFVADCSVVGSYCPAR